MSIDDTNRANALQRENDNLKTENAALRARVGRLEAVAKEAKNVIDFCYRIDNRLEFPKLNAELQALEAEGAGE